MAFDEHEPTGSKRSRPKTFAIIYASEDEQEANKDAWRLGELGQLATIKTPDDEVVTLGAPIGTAKWKSEFLKHKALIGEEMIKKAELLDNQQAQYLLARAALGTAKVNAFDEVLWWELGP